MFQFTEAEIDQLEGDVLLPDSFSDIEKIVNTRWPEPQRWISKDERMPTEADGMNGSLKRQDDNCVLWMLDDFGVKGADWNKPPEDSVAWCRIPDYAPPVVDKDREEFEAWAEGEAMILNRDEHGGYIQAVVRRMWFAWQAARKGGLSK